MQTNGGTVTTTHAGHLPHNNIENMDTLYYISQYNKQHTRKAEQSNRLAIR
jgi:hypothetical protein